MALDDSALLEMIEMLRTADGGELMRRLLGGMLQGVVDAEAAAHIGAQLHERTDARMTRRNGTRDKLVATGVGDLTVKIPKLRSGSFFPALLAPRRRIDVALHAVVMQAYVEGVSTRRVDDLVIAMGAPGSARAKSAGSASSTLSSRSGAPARWSTSPSLTIRLQGLCGALRQARREAVHERGRDQRRNNALAESLNATLKRELLHGASAWPDELTCRPVGRTLVTRSGAPRGAGPAPLGSTRNQYSLAGREMILASGALSQSFGDAADCNADSD